jgi:hypothetical protein
MSNSFNPYSQWLGLAGDVRRPTHYELLSLPPGEPDAKKISLAAEQAATKIRSFRPGPHASDWARLLDEVQAARLALLDPARKAEYDRSLSLEPASAKTESRASGGKPPLSDLFPPGFRAAAPPASAPAPQLPQPVAPAAIHSAVSAPVEPAAEEPWNTLPPAAQASPTMPLPAGAAGGYSAPYAVPSGYPTALPTTGYAQPLYPPAHGAAPYGTPMPVDPMAPVAIPGVSAAYPSFPVAVPYPMPAAVPMGQPLAPQGTFPATAPVAPAAEVTQVRKASAASVMMAARKERQTRSAAVLAGGAAGLVIVAGLGAYMVFTSKFTKPADRDVAQADPHNGKHKPAKANRDDRPVEIPKTPVPVSPPPPTTKDSDPPTLDPMPPPPESVRITERPPMPEPKPEPAPPMPEPKPEPKPAPTVKPTRQQVVELEMALKRSRLALSEQSFDEAEAEAAKAKKVALLPEHRALVERLRLAIDHTKLFRQALAESAARLDAAETIKVGSSTVVAIVETFPDKITVRINGMNRTYSFASIPPGLAVAILDTKRIGGQPDTRILKAMFVATAKDADEEAIGEARRWLQEVEASDPSASALLQYLGDSYEGIVAAFDAAEKNAADGNTAAAAANQDGRQ